MKKIYLIGGLITTMMSFGEVYAQTDNVGIGTAKPEQSAILDIQSSDKGVLFPRMTESQRNAIKNPANGLIVNQIEIGENGNISNAGFYYYNGEKWASLNTSDANSVATTDINGWALDGNTAAGTNKAAATASSYIGTPYSIPINFKIGATVAGLIDPGTLQSTFIGYYAGSSNSTGSRNTALGYQAFKSNVSGSNNMAVGSGALQYNLDGFGNMALGYASLNKNISGNNNTGVGSFALFNNLGSNNLALGTNAGYLKDGSNNIYIGLNAGRPSGSTVLSESNMLYIHSGSIGVTNPLIKGNFSANSVHINSKTTGYLAIGDFDSATSTTGGTGGLPLPSALGTSGGYRLVVQDGILCEKVKVALRATGSSDWADYVFEPEYDLMSLDKVEEFVKENKHLPNVPSLKEVQENGLDFHETSRMFMEKIEELTLYVIDLNKQIKQLKKDNEILKEKLD